MTEADPGSLRLDPAPDVEPPFPLDLIVGALRDVLAERGKDVTIEPDARFDSLGVDSLDVAEFFVRLEELSGRFVDAMSADGLELVSDLARLRPLAEG